MEKKQAIEEIKTQSAHSKITGFQVLSMNSDDMEEYAPDSMKERFSKMTIKQKQRFLSLLMDEVYETLESADKYGFKQLFKDTIGYMEEEGRMEEIYETATAVK